MSPCERKHGAVIEASHHAGSTMTRQAVIPIVRDVLLHKPGFCLSVTGGTDRQVKAVARAGMAVGAVEGGALLRFLVAMQRESIYGVREVRHVDLGNLCFPSPVLHVASGAGRDFR
jgi:hypothetical protein